MWLIHSQNDPIIHSAASVLEKPLESAIVTAKINLEALMPEPRLVRALKEGGRDAMVALADFCARLVALSEFEQDVGAVRVQIEPLDRSLRSQRRMNKKAQRNCIPYILERSDVYCLDDVLVCCVRAMAYVKHEALEEKKLDATREAISECLNNATSMFLSQTINFSLDATSLKAMQHVSCAVLQNRMREALRQMRIVAFIAEGSILPRRSGASSQPMQSPPAVPFKAPSESRLSTTIVVQGTHLNSSVSVEMGSLRPFLQVEFPSGESKSSVLIPGMIVPQGITLIVGGGYHGKSTMLRTIALGVYNKIPGDGREFCVTVSDAVCVRVEDGRYVNHCNVSAFISNLPKPEGMTSSLDTHKFSSREASGSTSQAANVSEAIEMGASALLVDEDISAANFMARDGRMRALVADESITPLLYRVNGLYTTHGISSVVVVGGVGDWLDVPNNVILLDKYVASDATKKAESISRQFSHGHVQYAGRGLVHRLDWDKGGTPTPRRITQDSINSLQGTTCVSLMEGANMVAIESEQNLENNEDGVGSIDMSRCEQLVSKKAQLFACGLAVAWMLKRSKSNPSLSIADLLAQLEDSFISLGMTSSLLESSDSTIHPSFVNMLESVGFLHRPRRYEIFMALTRLRGISFEEMPMHLHDEEEATRLEAERKKQEDLDAWHARRRKNRFN